MAVGPADAVDALNAVFGRHRGFRAAHAKGTVCRGTFRATPEAAALTRAAHMQAEPVRATIRFSNSTGDPGAPDGEPGARGMAVQLYLPDGSRTDIVTVTSERFFARSPEEFVRITRAGRPGLGRPFRVIATLLRHGEAVRVLRAGLRKPPVPSYANCRYHGLHAFRWIAADGSERHVRYTWVPEAGEASLDEADAAARALDYLQSEIRERLAREPVRFALELTLAAPGDPVDDPRAAWPDERERVHAGTLEISGLDDERERDGDVLVFDPTRLTDGIEPTDDPILRFRPDAYAVSIERRSGAVRAP